MHSDHSSFLNASTNFDELKKYMNLINSVVIALDKDGNIIFLNQKGCETIECSLSTAVGKNWVEDFIPKSEKLQLKKMISHFFNKKDGNPNTNDNPFITTSGKLHYIHWNNTAIRDNSGKIILMLSSGEDITQQVRDSKLLKESENRLKKAEELVMMGNWERNLLTGEYICSNGFFKIMGYENDEMKPAFKNFLATVHPDDKEKTRLSVENSYKNKKGYSIEFRILRKDGKLRHIKAESIFAKDSKEEPTKAFGTVRDITETRRNEQNLIIAEMRLKKAENIAKMGNWEVDLETHCYECSDGFLTLCGITSEEFDHSVEFMLEMTHPDDREYVNSVIENYNKTGENYSLENRILKPDGSIAYVLSRGTYLKDEYDKPIKSIGTIIDITELKIKESQIKEREERLKQAEIIAKIGHWSLVHKTKKYECSDGFCRICGLDAKTFKPSAETLAATVHPEDRKTVSDLLDITFMTGEDYNLNHRIVLPDGTIRHINTKGTYIKNKDGIPIKTIGAILDITDFVEKDKMLTANERRLKEAENIAQIGHWEWDRLTNTHIVSDGLFDIIGYKSIDELPSREFINTVFHENDSKMIHETVRNSYITGKPYTYEARAIRPSGEIRHVKVQGFPVLDKKGDVVKTKGTYSDITEIKNYQKKLYENELRLKKAEEIAQIGYWEKGLITGEYLCSDGFYKVFGHLPGDFKPTLEVLLEKTHIDDRDMVLEKIENAEKTKTNYVRENRIILPDNELRYIESTTAYIKNENGDIIKSVGTIMDITKEKLEELQRIKLEQQLRNQQKLESIGILAGGVAHEINNPINGIMNYSQLILDSLDFNEENAEFAREIIRETERVSTIVRNLLQFSRQEKVTYQPTDIIDILNNTLSLVNTIIKKEYISIKTDMSKNLPRFMGNSQQIQQVLLNLITNSRDSLNEKYEGFNENKTITIKCRKINRNKKTYISLSVADTGMGIDPEIKNRIFDPFFTTKTSERGTGLGLSISYGIIEEHNGRIYFETKNDITRFIVELPAEISSANIG